MKTMIHYAMCLSVLLPPVTGAQQREEKEEPLAFETTVSLNFKGADLIDILRLLSVQHNLNIITGREVTGEVNVSLIDVGLGTALDAILKVNGYDWFIQDRIIVVKPVDQEMTGELLTRVYKLEYVDATGVSSALENVVSPKGKVQIFSPVISRGATGAGAVGGAGGVGGVGGVGVSGGAAGRAGGGQRGISGGAGGVGIPVATHLLVTDIRSNFPAIEKVIRELDKQIAQINIAVKFVETNLKADERLGIDWSLRSRLSGPVDETLVGPDVFSIGKWNTMRIATLSLPLFTSIMEILSSDDDTRLLQEPQVSTKDNTLASLSVGTTIPVPVPQPAGGVFGELPLTFEDVDISITLNVQPRINEERFISMSVIAVVQALTGFTPQGERPIVSQRTAQTEVMVANGQTLLMGGLIFDHHGETTKGVPLLRRIPLLGNFFRHKSTTKEQRELLIFITPNIIEVT